MNGIVGGWTLANFEAVNLPEEVAAAFKAAIKKLLGATYTPVLYCGCQVVKGINYMILCEQKLSDPAGTRHLVKMIINSFQGQCDVVSIETIL